MFQSVFDKRRDNRLRIDSVLRFGCKDDLSRSMHPRWLGLYVLDFTETVSSYRSTRTQFYMFLDH